MIRKQNIWFLTLFSLILVLSVYYVTIPNQLLLTDNNINIPTNVYDEDNIVNLEINEMGILQTLRVSLNDERFEMVNDLQVVLNSLDASTQEKNNAYEQIKLLDVIKAQEEKLEKKILQTYQLNSFIKINNNDIRVTIENSEHTEQLANNIMRSIQEEYENKMYISIMFE